LFDPKIFPGRLRTTFPMFHNGPFFFSLVLKKKTL
jgi:hypothetical protein